MLQAMLRQSQCESKQRSVISVVDPGERITEAGPTSDSGSSGYHVYIATMRDAAQLSRCTSKQIMAMAYRPRSDRCKEASLPDVKQASCTLTGTCSYTSAQLL